MRIARLFIGLMACLAPAAALAQDPFREPLPLVEIFGAGSDTGFDLAGIRCAALVVAQEEWVKAHGTGQRPTRAQMQSVELNLTLAEQHRLNAGVDIVAAQETTRADVLAAMAMYTSRFAANAGSGHPWRGDRMVGGDAAYCDILNDR